MACLMNATAQDVGSLRVCFLNKNEIDHFYTPIARL